MTLGPMTHAVCAKCGRVRAVRKDGTIVMHRIITRRDRWAPRQECEGTYTKPAHAINGKGAARYVRALKRYRAALIELRAAKAAR